MGCYANRITYFNKGPAWKEYYGWYIFKLDLVHNYEQCKLKVTHEIVSK